MSYDTEKTETTRLDGTKRFEIYLGSEIIKCKSRAVMDQIFGLFKKGECWVEGEGHPGEPEDD